MANKLGNWFRAEREKLRELTAKEKVQYIWSYYYLNVQLLAIEAARTLKKDMIYQAVMMDPHAGAELSMDDIVAMCDEMIEPHGDWMPKYS